MKDNTMKRGGKMKKIFQLGMLVFVGLMGFFVLQPSIAFGQTFVRDDAGVLSQETIKQIDTLNKEGFQSLTGAPEYAVITIPSLDGQSIEERNLELFNEYGIGNPEDNNGLLFLFAIDDREFRLGYGDGLSYVFSELSEDDLVDEDAKDALRDEDYDTAILAASNEVYQRMKEADETIGLGTIYQDGKQMLAEKQAQEAEATKQMWFTIGKIVSGVVAAAAASLVGFISFRHLKTKRRFEEHLPLPKHLLEDSHFQQKDFLKWASNRKNYQRYHQYQTAKDCQQAFTQYVTRTYVPAKLSSVTGLSTADKRVIQHGLMNPAIGAYFSNLLTKKQTTVKHFGQVILTQHDTLKTYEAQLGREVTERMADYDLTDAVLPENLPLADAYRAEIAKQAKEEIRRRNEQGRYLAQLVTEKATYPEMVQAIPKEVSDVLAEVKTDALFQVDLKQVYQNHPDLANKLSSFDASDRAAVLNNARQEYDPHGMNMALFFVMMNNHVTHQEQVIADTQSSSNDFGGFSGGSSSGGGVSGSW
ncbi:TPM domain-containing protein [Enterococcus casseliflavus]